MKDPTLLARAKRYFENLRREQCEELDEFHMREQTSSTTREHRPMYQRKRKKVQKLVVLVPKIRISHTIQEFLRKRYPPDSDRAARWAARKKCRSTEGTLQEKKLQEFMTQFQSGTSHSKSRPYSVSQRVANLDSQSRPPSSCSSQQSSSTCHEMASNPQCLEQNIDRHNEDKSISSSLAPMERLIKCEMMDYENISPNENPLLTVKREMLECPHHNTHVKSEPIDYSESECVRNHPNKMPRTDSEQNSSATSSLLSENVASLIMNSHHLPYMRPLHKTARISLQIFSLKETRISTTMKKRRNENRRNIKGRVYPFLSNKSPWKELPRNWRPVCLGLCQPTMHRKISNLL